MTYNCLVIQDRHKEEHIKKGYSIPQGKFWAIKLALVWELFPIAIIIHMTLFNSNNSSYCSIAAYPLQAFWHCLLIYCDLHAPYFNTEHTRAQRQTGLCFSAAVWLKLVHGHASSPSTLKDDQLFCWPYFGSGFISQPKMESTIDQNFVFIP